MQHIFAGMYSATSGLYTYLRQGVDNGYDHYHYPPPVVTVEGETKPTEGCRCTHLGDGPLHAAVPGVARHGAGGGVAPVTAGFGLEGGHGLGHARGEGELLPQLHVGPALGCNTAHC